MHSCVTIIHQLQNGLIVEVSLDLFGNVRGQEEEAFDYLTTKLLDYLMNVMYYVYVMLSLSSIQNNLRS